MDTIPTMRYDYQFMIHGVILLICHDHLFLHVYMWAVWVFLWNLDILRDTALGDDRVNIHIRCSYTHFFFLIFEKQAGCCSDTTNLTASHSPRYL